MKVILYRKKMKCNEIKFDVNMFDNKQTSVIQFT